MTNIEQNQTDTLVTTDWLSQHLEDPDLMVLDCSISMKPNDDGSFQNVGGRDAYDTAHIPGAGFADLFGNLSDKGTACWSLPCQHRNSFVRLWAN